MKNSLGIIKLNLKKQLQVLGVLFLVFGFTKVSYGQVTSTVDSTKIKIGEQITYKIAVEADSTDLVVFPEGQTFSPLEVIQSYEIDTTKQEAKFNLIKKYGLTQFDSGSYIIPNQKILIGDKIFFTDSLRVEVNTVVVDTTKQGLYDIKPFMEVKEPSSNWWKILLAVLGIFALVGGLLYWFLWRKKPLTEEEKIALLPPYDRAKMALKSLDESDYLQKSELKEYYSELTFIIRRYLDEKVYDRALESTTDELIERLYLLREGNQISISKEDIQNLESILKRADLVKFAKSAPDVALAEMDRNTIDLEIDHVKESLPEPTEEEKLLDQQYKEEQERKKKRKKVIITVVIAFFLMMATVVGLGIKYGFAYVKDTVIGHESKELLEGEWVSSDYGVPPISISTPRVLKRVELPLPKEAQGSVKVTAFSYGTLLDMFSVMVSTTVLQQPPQGQQAQGADQSAPKIDLAQASEMAIAGMEQKGAKDILVKREQFITPNAAEGLKTYGSLSIPLLNTETLVPAKYTILQFTSENVLQQVMVTWPDNDVYADEMIDRIINSVELVKKEQEAEQEK
ncbi:BatD family protein [Mangrovimonas xylaniphaga]|uniref:BatD family protein n=1 Tax=Mangrovimonas xylaniphaga TaxID=1645915 RepID=UPI0006B4D763|nr:BatD family protein [Mangrovimonas xylaniphaga]